MNKEPALLIKVLEEIVRAAVPLALIFGWVNWTDAQTGTVLMFIGVLTGGLSVLVTRSQVVAKDVANKQIETAVLMPSNSSVADVKRAAAAAEESNQ